MIRAMNADATAWVRLGRFIQQERAAKGLSQSAAAEAAGINRGVWSAVEKAAGTKPYDTTLAAIERVLDWEPGSCETILGGGEPTIRQVPRRVTPVEHWRIVVAALENPNVDWDFDKDMLDLLTRKAREALKRAQDRANRDSRDVG